MQPSSKPVKFESDLYFLKLSKANGPAIASMETSHIMILYFIVHGLEVNKKESLLDVDSIKNYVKSLQLPNGGFTCSSLYNFDNTENLKYNLPHIVFTYSAVNILKSLGGLQEINCNSCVDSIIRCQQTNGSFSNFQNSNEADLRFVYAALASLRALGALEKVNRTKTLQYLEDCLNYDGGYGLRPGCESHAGAIYCALCAFQMLNQKPPQKFLTLEFLVNRQTENQNRDIVGVQGRVGKLPDSCYTFWVGASIKILTGQSLLNEKVQNFLQLCYHEESLNFSKYPKVKGDPLHTLHSTVGLRILKGEADEIDIIQGIVRGTEKQT